MLAAIAAERDEPERAATLLGQAERLRAEAGVEVPAFQRDDVAGAREAAVAALGADAFPAAFERGRQATRCSRPPELGLQRQRGATSAPSWMVRSSRTPRGRPQEDPVSAFLYRLGRNSARHPFRVLGLWLVAAVAVVGPARQRRRRSSTTASACPASSRSTRPTS